MIDSLDYPSLYVEGVTDLHTIVYLLNRHGIVLDKDTGPILIKNAKNDVGVLKAMRTAAKASTNRPVGFVIDADASVSDRWRSICGHLGELGLDIPPSIPSDGFVGPSSVNKAKVGVWIMPDNQTDQGMLEDLVRTLVPSEDSLIEHAQKSTDTAVKLGAKFPDQAKRKAELHAWLAWQKEPGHSFGTAIKTHYFQHDSDVAMKFVAWFKRLYHGRI